MLWDAHINFSYCTVFIYDNFRKITNDLVGLLRYIYYQRNGVLKTKLIHVNTEKRIDFGL